MSGLRAARHAPSRHAVTGPGRQIRPQLVRAAVLPTLAAGLSGAAAVIFTLQLGGGAGDRDARLWPVLTGCALLVLGALAAALLGAQRAAKAVRDRCEALRRSSVRGRQELRGVADRLERGEAPPRPVRGGPTGPPAGVDPAVVDEFWLLSQELRGAREQAHATLVRLAGPAAPSDSERKVEVFVNLARRLQSLVHREISLLDELEDTVEDPDLLKELFHVDHLATRIRRHAENLAVLGGAASRRQWTRPIDLSEVLRSSVAEVEQYTRVKVVPPAGGSVRGHAVADVVHLLAELVENATVFSAPDTDVVLRAERVTAGIAVEVEDRGLGMPAEEQHRMNALLGDPDQISVRNLLADGRIGLFVVSALARRHGIAVELKSNIYGGVLAVLVLPQELLGAEAPSAADAAGGSRATSWGTGRAAPMPPPLEPVRATPPRPQPRDPLPEREREREPWPGAAPTAPAGPAHGPAPVQGAGGAGAAAPAGSGRGPATGQASEPGPGAVAWDGPAAPAGPAPGLGLDSGNGPAPGTGHGLEPGQASLPGQASAFGPGAALGQESAPGQVSAPGPGAVAGDGSAALDGPASGLEFVSEHASVPGPGHRPAPGHGFGDGPGAEAVAGPGQRPASAAVHVPGPRSGDETESWPEWGSAPVSAAPAPAGGEAQLGQAVPQPWAAASASAAVGAAPAGTRTRPAAEAQPVPRPDAGPGPAPAAVTVAPAPAEAPAPTPVGSGTWPGAEAQRPSAPEPWPVPAAGTGTPARAEVQPWSWAEPGRAPATAAPAGSGSRAVPAAQPVPEGPAAAEARPPLPRRRAQQHLAPQLREAPAPRRAADPEQPVHDPGLMAAFQRGFGLAQSENQV